MEKEAANRGKFNALLKTQASVVPFLFEDGCSFADFNEAIAKRQSQGKQHPHNDKFTLFYGQSGFDVTLDSDEWEAFLYHIRSLEDKTMILKVLTNNSPKSALTSLLFSSSLLSSSSHMAQATDSPNLKSRDIGMPSTSRNDTERESGLKIVNQNNVTTSESSKLLQTIEEQNGTGQDIECDTERKCDERINQQEFY